MLNICGLIDNPQEDKNENDILIISLGRSHVFSRIISSFQVLYSKVTWINSTKIYISVLMLEFRYHHSQVCNFIDLFTLLALDIQNCENNLIRIRELLAILCLCLLIYFFVNSDLQIPEYTTRCTI